MNKWYGVMTLAMVLAAGCGTKQDESTMIQQPLTVSLKGGEFKAASGTIRLCSYNIQNFTDGIFDGWHRSPIKARTQARRAAELLDEINPDVVMIQEIEAPRSLRLLNRQLAQPYPLGYITRFAGRGRGRKLNIALLTRLEPREVSELDFAQSEWTNRPPRGVLRAAFDLEDDRGLLVYGVHLKSNWGDPPRNIARRQRAMELIRDDVETWRAVHEGTWEIAVMGDMNVDPELEQFAEDSSLVPLDDWSDLWLGRPIEERTTIPTRYGDTNMVFPPAAFDRIIVADELQQEPWVVQDIGVLQRGVNTENIHARPGDDPDNASDHYPVYVDMVR